MKRGIFCTALLLVLLLVCIVALPTEAHAATITDSGTCGDNLTWTLDSDGTLTISGTGPMDNYAYRTAPWYGSWRSVKNVTITDGVISIGDWAFSWCESIISIAIPDSITSIGKCAFYECTSLTSVNIPDSVTSIGDEAFVWCSSLSGIAIPDGVTSIGDSAFLYCTRLASIVIPDSVTSIGNQAFYHCESLTSITIPDGVTGIGNNVFYGCTSLTSVTIPDSVTSIGDWAFSSCTSLTSITIPDSVTTIGMHAFENCDSLTSIAIPGSVTSIGDSAFFSCNSLTGIWVDENNPNYSSDASGVLFDKEKFNLIASPGAISEYVIPDSVFFIGDYAFYHCDSLTSITIPNSVCAIDWGAFTGCTSLTSIAIPDSVSYIGDCAFESCGSLTNITISNRVTSIGNYMFFGCTHLTNITIPDSVTSIGDNAFYGCTSLTSITIPDSVTSIGNWAFYDCTNLETVWYGGACTGWKTEWENVSIGYGNEPLTNATIVYASHNYSDGVCADCGYKCTHNYNKNGICTSCGNVIVVVVKSGTCGENLTWTLDSAGTLIISGVGPMENYVYFTNVPWPTYSDSIKQVVIADGVTSIGNYAFGSLTSLTNITIPNSVTSIGASAFSQCESLTSVIIGNSVTSIGSYAFQYCAGLTSITIPNSVTSIGDYAFSFCTSLTDIWVDEDNPAYSNDTFGVLFNKNKTSLIVAPANIAGKYVIPDSVTTIGRYAFNNCTSLTSVTIPDSVTSIGSYAFQYCAGLTSIEIPDSVTSVGDQAFKDCTNLGSITLPDSVTSIGSFAFYRCSSLTSITIPNSVTSIDYSTFYWCDSLETVYYTGSCAEWENISISDRNEPLTNATIVYASHNYSDGVCADCGYECAHNYENGTCTICGDVAVVIVASGTCGDNLTWTLDSNGTLTISGTGSMTNYNPNGAPYSNGAPWYGVRNSIKTAVIESGVTSIGAWSFYECTSLTSVTIGNSVAGIGYHAFSECAILPDITIPDGIAYIGDYAFSGCNSLTNITIPASVARIDYNAFFKCTSLNGIWVDKNNLAYGSDAFGVLFDKDKTTLITAPGATAGEYVIPSSVTSIGSYAFAYCKNLVGIEIPDSVTAIGGGAFSNCTSLTGVTIGNGVTSIGSNAFGYCTNLTSITIPDSVTSIGIAAFEYCDSLVSVTIGNGVTSVGDNAFFSCTSLTGLTIGSSVTSISDGTFAYCSNLTSITIPDSITTIGRSAFYSCNSLETVCYAGSCAEWREISIDANNKPLTNATLICASHSWDAGVHTPATETENGYTTYTCVCGETSWVEDAIFDTGDMEEPEGDPVTDEEKNTILDRIEQAGDDIKIVVGFEDPKNKDKIEEMQDKNPDLKDKAPKLHIAAKKMFITGDKATKVVYDVTPMLGDQKLELGSEITFRLPVDSNIEVLYAYVFHEDECIGRFEIHGSASEGKYVIVTAKEFSLYTVDIQPPCEHTPGGSYIGTVTKEPTKTEAGEMTYTCSYCGDTYTEVIPALFYGTNTDLGNTLNMNFYFYKELVSADGYVEIVRSFADGSTETTKKNLSEFGLNGDYYQITYPGLAAMEMNDAVSVTVYDKDGNQISETKTDSICSYARRALDKITDPISRRMYVDMLNYGAAAQLNFGYDTENLANSILTEAEKAEGTQSVAALTNSYTRENNNYYGTNFDLENEINLNLYVLASAMGANGYAEISYTNFKGEEIQKTITEYTVNGGYYMFTPDFVVAADGRCLLTIQFYKADGTPVVTVTDSMESYVARAVDADPTKYSWMEYMMIYSDSAREYLNR